MTNHTPASSSSDPRESGYPSEYPAGNPFEPPLSEPFASEASSAEHDAAERYDATQRDDDADRDDVTDAQADTGERDDAADEQADASFTHADTADEGVQFDRWAETLEPAPVDLDALLASVSAYGTAEAVLDDTGEGSRARTSPPQSAPYAPVPYTPGIALPPLHTLRRGSPGSLAPAFALIAIGGWLTFTLATGGAVQPLHVLAAVLAAVVFSVLAHAVGRRLWSPGLVFTAVLVGGLAVLAAAVLVPGGLDGARAYPLVLGAAGLAVLAAGLFGRPRVRGAWWPGLLLLVGAGVGLAYTLGALPAALVAPVVPFWPVFAALVVLLLVLPLLTRRRGRA
jgi:hypothetical protein